MTDGLVLPLARSTLPVSEIFGPVWQGEGPYTGTRVMFLRLGLCNLHCEWCDTAYTWDQTRYDLSEELVDMTPKQVLDQLGDWTCPLVISGGEPLIHQTLLEPIVRTYPRAVHIESNGTLPPPSWTDAAASVALSPKIITTADPEKRRIKPKALRRWSLVPWAFLKIVCSTADDVWDAATYVKQWGDWTDRVWIMPEGRTRDEVLRHAAAIEQAVMDEGWHLTLRQHVLLYGEERGR